MVGRLNDKIDHWLFDEYRMRVEDLAVYRMFFAAMAFAIYVPRGLWTAGVPMHFWSPPAGPGAILDGPLPYWAMVGLNCLLVWFCFAIFIGDNTPAASIGLGVTLILINGVCYSFGKIDHDIIFPLAAFLLAFSGWGGAKSLDASSPPPVRPWCLALLAICLGIGMFTAAWPKLIAGWLVLDTHAVKNTTYTFAAAPHAVPGTSASLRYTPDWLWELQDWAAVALEFGFIVAALRLSWFRAVLVVAILFHMGIQIVLGIPFSLNVVVYAAFFPVTKLIKPALVATPFALALTVVLCNMRTVNEFVSEFTVMLGGVLAIGYIAWLPFRRVG